MAVGAEGGIGLQMICKSAVLCMPSFAITLGGLPCLGRARKGRGVRVELLSDATSKCECCALPLAGAMRYAGGGPKGPATREAPFLLSVIRAR